MTCRWVQCSLPATDRAFFCHEHGSRIAAAHTSTRPDLDAERSENQ